MKFYTIGHSTHDGEDFISILREYRIELLVDVRAFPGSRKNPQFNEKELRAALSENNMEYLWLGKELGGYRKKSDGLGTDSPNKGWKAGGFRIYADYMLSEKFQSAAERLVGMAENRRVVYMCAEKFYWRCHRRLISDYLLSQGHEVWHIVDRNTVRKHEITEFARIRGKKLTYPPQESPPDSSLF